MPGVPSAFERNYTMPAKSTQPKPGRFRLDAVVLTVFTLGGVLAVAVGCFTPISGSANPFGESGDWIAALVVDALGWAVIVFVAAWFVLSGLLVVTRSPLRIACRFLGWAILISWATAAVDWWSSGLRQISAAGPGGSVGAYLRFALEDAFEPVVALAVYWTS